mgnify:CR=1 FL=1
MAGSTPGGKKVGKKKPKSFISHVNAQKRHQAALESMHPVFRARVEALVDHMNKKGWQAFVWQGKTRSEAQAAANAKKGTGIKMSWHRPEVHGRIGALLVELYAADIVDERWGWEGPASDQNHQFWKDLGGFAKAEALEWGGDWTKKDVAHVQMMLMDMAMPDSVVV